MAETVTFDDGSGTTLSELARLDTMVTFVDAATFADELDSLVTKRALSHVEAVLKQLNPAAKLLPTSYGQVPVADILGTGRFDFERGMAAPGWQQVLRGQESSETDEYGIASFAYRRRWPFHPYGSGVVEGDLRSVAVLESRASRGDRCLRGDEGPSTEETETNALTASSLAPAADRIIDFAGLRPGDRVLDVTCRLPVPSAHFDLVVSVFGVIFFSDATVEMVRRQGTARARRASVRSRGPCR